jgi:flagellar biosynthesis protein FlhG
MKGYRTALIDADLGLANIHILCGHQPKRTLLDMVESGIPMAQIIEKGPGSVDLIVGGSGTDELANLPRHHRFRLISELENLEKAYEVVVIDTSPGISKNVTDFVNIADRVVLLTTPDLTSTTDAYGLLKTVLGGFPEADIGIVCNMTRARAQAEVVFTRLDVCARRFLKATIRNLGHIPRDPVVGRANSIQRPYLLVDPDSRAAQHTLKLADRALEPDPKAPTKKQPSFRELFRQKDPFLEQALDHKEVRYITR